jgi:hypothetical protein
MAQGLSLIHIGLAKTATTALQMHFFPHLGLPYIPYSAGNWYKHIRFAPEFALQPLGYRAVTSGENLCNQGAVGSDAIAERLRTLFGPSLVLLVVRRTDEHFVSWYRQMIMTELSRFAEKRKQEVAAGGPERQIARFQDIDGYFDSNLDVILRPQQDAATTLTNSYFMTLDLDRNVAAFRKAFDVMVFDYDLIRNDLPAFSRTVCDRLGIAAPAVSLAREKTSSAQALDDMLATLPADLVAPEFRDTLAGYYADAKLSADRSAFLAAYTQMRCAETFAAAIRK